MYETGMAKNNPSLEEILANEETIEEVEETIEEVEETIEEVEMQQYKVVNCAALSLRETKDKVKGKILSILQVGSLLIVKNIDQDWANVITDDGKEGYVVSNYLERI